MAQPQCAAMKPSGHRCKRAAARGDRFCSTHTDTFKRCTAHNRGSGGVRCGRPAMAGSSVCRAHGGANPTVVAAAKRRELEQRAQRLVDQLGDDVAPIEDPILELAALLGRVKAVEQALWAKLHADPDELALAVYGEHVDRLGKFLTKTVELGIMDRAVAIREEQAAVMAHVFTSTLVELRSWLSVELTQRALATTDVFELTSALDRRARELFHDRLLETPQELEPTTDAA